MADAWHPADSGRAAQTATIIGIFPVAVGNALAAQAEKEPGPDQRPDHAADAQRRRVQQTARRRLQPFDVLLPSQERPFGVREERRDFAPDLAAAPRAISDHGREVRPGDACGGGQFAKGQSPAAQRVDKFPVGATSSLLW